MPVFFKPIAEGRAGRRPDSAVRLRYDGVQPWPGRGDCWSYTCMVTKSSMLVLPEESELDVYMRLIKMRLQFLTAMLDRMKNEDK